MVVVYKFRALTDVWTGSVEKDASRCVSTGLLGSIRWWLEVLVRGLGGSACDPSSTQCKNEKHCVVCELFGCTGGARKFRFEVLDAGGTTKKDQIKENDIFSFRFTELRPIKDEEWALLDATFRLISEYGAIGGKTVLKPTDEKDRLKEKHHKDYGIIQITHTDHSRIAVNDFKTYFSDTRWCNESHNGFGWASLKNFWFVDGRILSREGVENSSFNKVLGRKDSKRCGDYGSVHNPPNKCPQTKKHPKRESEQFVNNRDEIAKWLAGKQQESKKVFSFKESARTFGFVNPDKRIDFSEMKERLKKVWPDLKDEQFTEGSAVINELFGKEHIYDV